MPTFDDSLTPDEISISSDPGRIYGEPVIEQIPRLVGLVDRNRHSPTYGSAHRNFWHHRSEEFTNNQFQEIALCLAHCYQLDRNWNPYRNSETLLRIMGSVLEYWVRLQQPNGSFDDLYRGSESYVATAFSTYCSTEAVILLSEMIDTDTHHRVSEAADRAAHWLFITDEELANNQLAGAIMALVNTAELSGEDRHMNDARSLFDKLLSRQENEGWFAEYGGADIGYCSLTLGYLATLWKRTHWEESKQAAEKLLEFLAPLVFHDGTAGGVIGSRNTEYFMPHGIEILAPTNALAAAVSNRILKGLVDYPSGNPIRRFDDRFLAYLGGFFLQAALDAKPRDSLRDEIIFDRNRIFEKAGIRSLETQTMHAVINLRKGGAFRCQFKDAAGRAASPSQPLSFVDSGVFLETADGVTFTSQELVEPKSISLNEDATETSGTFHQIISIQASPWKLLAFKAFNLTVPSPVRKWVAERLRRKAVSTGREIGEFRRWFSFTETSLSVTDQLTIPPGRHKIRLSQETELAFSFASCGFCQPSELRSQAAGAYMLTVDGPDILTITRNLTPDGWSRPNVEGRD